ncbi:MAG: signal peptidase I [Ferrimicrobium sp.]|jgi:signal peptidase|nr:signal peptidase I [Ferrimicrobium sp.]
MLLRRAVALLVCLLVVALGFSVLSGRWELLPVLSGSMSPGMPTGSIAFAQREPISDLKLHDVAVFHPPNSTRVIYLHRVISLKRVHGEVVVRTKGDANPVPDPWTLHITSSTVYIVRYSVSHAGYVVLWVHSKTGREVILTVAGLLAFALVVSALRDGGRKVSAAAEE